MELVKNKSQYELWNALWSMCHFAHTSKRVVVSPILPKDDTTGNVP